MLDPMMPAPITTTCGPWAPDIPAGGGRPSVSADQLWTRSTVNAVNGLEISAVVRTSGTVNAVQSLCGEIRLLGF